MFRGNSNQLCWYLDTLCEQMTSRLGLWKLLMAMQLSEAEKHEYVHKDPVVEQGLTEINPMFWSGHVDFKMLRQLSKVWRWVEGWEADGLEIYICDSLGDRSWLKPWDHMRSLRRLMQLENRDEHCCLGGLSYWESRKRRQDHERRLGSEECPEERKKEIPRREEDRNQRSCGALGAELRKCPKNEGKVSSVRGCWDWVKESVVCQCGPCGLRRERWKLSKCFHTLCALENCQNRGVFIHFYHLNS